MKHLYVLSEADLTALGSPSWRWADPEEWPAPMIVRSVEGRHSDYAWLAACPECPWQHFVTMQDLAHDSAEQHIDTCPARRFKALA